MNIQEFAKMLNGRQYGNELTREEEKLATELGYIVVFGYSDDNMELRGAIHDEFGCFDGGTAYLDENGIIEECECECKHYEKALEKAKYIEACWCREDADGFTWSYETDFPHAHFEVYDEDEKYCLGVVFDIKELMGGAG
jgi:hypothetical protein